MGYLNFDGGAFDLTISFRYTPPTDDLRRWQRTFTAASHLLAEATDGQCRFGKLRWIGDCGGSEVADVFISGKTVANSSARPGAGNEDGGAIMLSRGQIDSPFLVVHEFGHYAFGLEDEYYFKDGDPNPHPGCRVDHPDADHCIMGQDARRQERFENGTLVRGTARTYCTPQNHTVPPGKPEDMPSCWDRILAAYPGLRVPIPWPERPREVRVPDPDWLPLAAGTRLVVVGADADQLAEPAVVRGLGALRTVARDHEQLLELDAVSQTACGRLATQIESCFPEQERVVVQAIVLLPGVQPRDAHDAEQLVRRARALGVHVVALGPPERAEEAFTGSVIARTNGALHVWSHAATDAQRAFWVQRQFTAFLGTVLDGHGLVDSHEQQLLAIGPTREHAFYVEEGARCAIFVCTVSCSGGVRVTWSPPRSASSVSPVGCEADASGNAIAVLRDPAPGFWVARVEPVGGGVDAIDYDVRVVSDNPAILWRKQGFAPVFHLGEEFDLRVDMQYPNPRLGVATAPALVSSFHAARLAGNQRDPSVLVRRTDSEPVRAPSTGESTVVLPRPERQVATPDPAAARVAQRPALVAVGAPSPLAAAEVAVSAHGTGADTEPPAMKPTISMQAVNQTLTASMRADAIGSSECRVRILLNGLERKAGDAAKAGEDPHRAGAFVRSVDFQVHVIQAPRRLGYGS